MVSWRRPLLILTLLAGCAPETTNAPERPPATLVSAEVAETGNPDYLDLVGVVRNDADEPMDVLLELRVLDERGDVVGGRRECTGEVPPRGTAPFRKTVKVEPGVEADGCRPAVRILEARPWSSP